MNLDKLLQKLPFYHHRWFQFIYFLIKNFINDDCQQKAASLTYTTMLSIVPMLTVLLVIISSIPAMASAKAQIQDLIYKNLLPSSSIQVSKYFNEFAEKSSNLTAIGVVMLFITAIMTLTTIQRAFNQIWRVEQREAGLISILQYWAIVTLGPLVLGTAFVISSAVTSLSFLNRKIGGYGIDWAFWVQVGSMAMMALGFVAMYWFVPRCKVRFSYALIAGLFVALTFELLKQTFGLVMSNFTSYEKIYGAFAALPIFLLWIYMSWNLILLGVEISYSLTVFETKEVYPRHPLLSLMDMLNVVYRAHAKGETVSEMDLRNVLGRKEMPHWYRYIRYLQDNHLITMTDSSNYILKRPLEQYTFWDFYQNLPYPLPHQADLKQIAEYDPWMQEWVLTLAKSEIKLQQTLAIPLAEIFNQVPPRKDPAEETQNGNILGLDKPTNDNQKVTHAEKILGTSASTPSPLAQAQARQKVENTIANANVTTATSTGLTGGQISDVTHNNATIEKAKTENTLPADNKENEKEKQKKKNKVNNPQLAGSTIQVVSMQPTDLNTHLTGSTAQSAKPLPPSSQEQGEIKTSGLLGLIGRRKPLITEKDNPNHIENR